MTESIDASLVSSGPLPAVAAAADSAASCCTLLQELCFILQTRDRAYYSHLNVAPLQPSATVNIVFSAVHFVISRERQTQNLYFI